MDLEAYPNFLKVYDNLKKATEKNISEINGKKPGHNTISKE